MVTDKDHIIRYGGMFALALAYVGTASNSAIRKLLHVAVSDVNDDVRRAAVSALGFVLLRSPDQVPKLVSLLAESYNPHVRYGSCIAIGIACARTGNSEAVRLLEPMLNDVSDFVRQGALLAMAMVLQQESETRNPKVGGCCCAPLCASTVMLLQSSVCRQKLSGKRSGSSSQSATGAR